MAAGSWEANSSRPAMSRSASRREFVPLKELLVLMLTLRPVLIRLVRLVRLFVDLKLVGVTGARMVDRVDCRAHAFAEEITNDSGG